MSTFGQYLREQRERDDNVGSLARDVRQDYRRPTRVEPVALRRRLDRRGADASFYIALDAAEKEWQAVQP